MQIKQVPFGAEPIAAVEAHLSLRVEGEVDFRDSTGEGRTEQGQFQAASTAGAQGPGHQGRPFIHLESIRKNRAGHYS
jgi:hypothetical protein